MAQLTISAAGLACRLEAEVAAAAHTQKMYITTGSVCRYGASGKEPDDVDDKGNLITEPGLASTPKAMTRYCKVVDKELQEVDAEHEDDNWILPVMTLMGTFGDKRADALWKQSKDKDLDLMMRMIWKQSKDKDLDENLLLMNF